MTRELIKKEIERRIDEISPFETVDIIDNELIDGMLNECAEDTLMKLPLHLLPVKSYSPAGIAIEDIFIRFNLPTDFLRIVKLKLASWNRHVSVLLSQESPKYKIQFDNQFLRATTNRPLAFLVNNSSIKEVHCFGKGVNNNPNVFYYCEKVLPEDFDNSILEALFYNTAFKVLVALEKAEQAKVALTLFDNFIKRNTTI